jgi:hypothetical protein
VDAVRQIADAVLYEGYILWPYRKSAIKNQHRWTFGGIYPEGWDEASIMQTQCLVEGDAGVAVDVGVRFLHVVDRQVLDAGPDGLEPVEELEVGAERHVSWQEAAERELTAEGVPLGGERTVELNVPEGSSREELGEAGALERSWRALEGAVDVYAERLGPRLFRLTVRISNTSPWGGGTRDDALRQTFCSSHTVLSARRGAFVSLTDPPADLREPAEGCRNTGTWPVLVGQDGERGTMLSSPIILPDYPQIAPESPGDLFDATEIDQMLVLNILSLTDVERRDMRDSDPRAREILERTEALSEEELLKLHGAIREFGLARRS